MTYFFLSFQRIALNASTSANILLFCLQDDASPAALTDLCLTYVSQNLDCFCVKRPDGSLCFREAVLFPQELADQLLAKMATEGKPGSKDTPEQSRW